MGDVLRTGILILTIASAATPPALWSQGSAVPRTRSKAPVPAQKVLPTKGVVESGTYKNASIGLEFTPASSLRLQEPEMKGTLDATPLLITVRAVADPGPFLGLFSERSTTVFYAEALAYYPEDKRGASNYVQRVIRAQEAGGFRHVGSVTSAQLSQTSFLRADFEKGKAHQAVFVTTHNGYAFVFIFGALDVGVTDKLIASTKIRVTN
jgi:hypothetical protein